jgi:hypothetical protein
MKRGYIFSLDAIIAVVIIMGGIVVISTTLPEQPDTETPRYLSSDLISLLFDIQIKDLCMGPPIHIASCRCVYPTLQDDFYCDGRVINTDMTLLEFFGFLYKISPSNSFKINDMINETISTSNLVPPNYDFTFLLTDLTIGLDNITTVYPIRW